MAKKAAPAPATFEPYVARDPYSVVEGTFFGRVLVVGRTFCGVRAVKRVVHMDHIMLGVREQVIPDWQRGAYTPMEETSLQSFISGIKNEALAHGATPLAVQWLGELSPFTTEELNIMAEKLKTKGTAKKADTKGADKADTKGADKKGNPEALKKAQEAAAGKRAELHSKKIKVLNKKHGAREGSKRAQMLDIVLASKTVAEAIEGGATMVDVRFAEEKEFISLS